MYRPYCRNYRVDLTNDREEANQQGKEMRNIKYPEEALKRS